MATDPSDGPLAESPEDDPLMRASELIERGDYRRARRALALASNSPPILQSPERADELARLRAVVGVDRLALLLTAAGALLLLAVVVLLLV